MKKTSTTESSKAKTAYDLNLQEYRPESEVKKKYNGREDEGFTYDEVHKIGGTIKGVTAYLKKIQKVSFGGKLILSKHAKSEKLKKAKKTTRQITEAYDTESNTFQDEKSLKDYYSSKEGFTYDSKYRVGGKIEDVENFIKNSAYDAENQRYDLIDTVKSKYQNKKFYLYDDQYKVGGTNFKVKQYISELLLETKEQRKRKTWKKYLFDPRTSCLLDQIYDTINNVCISNSNENIKKFMDEYKDDFQYRTGNSESTIYQEKIGLIGTFDSILVFLTKYEDLQENEENENTEEGSVSTELKSKDIIDPRLLEKCLGFVVYDIRIDNCIPLEKYTKTTIEFEEKEQTSKIPEITETLSQTLLDSLKRGKIIQKNEKIDLWLPKGYKLIESEDPLVIPKEDNYFLIEKNDGSDPIYFDAIEKLMGPKDGIEAFLSTYGYLSTKDVSRKEYDEYKNLRKNLSRLEGEAFLEEAEEESEKIKTKKGKKVGKVTQTKEKLGDQIIALISERDKPRLGDLYLPIKFPLTHKPIQWLGYKYPPPPPKDGKKIPLELSKIKIIYSPTRIQKYPKTKEGLYRLQVTTEIRDFVLNLYKKPTENIKEFVSLNTQVELEKKKIVIEEEFKKWYLEKTHESSKKEIIEKQIEEFYANNLNRDILLRKIFEISVEYLINLTSFTSNKIPRDRIFNVLNTKFEDNADINNIYYTILETNQNGFSNSSIDELISKAFAIFIPNLIHKYRNEYENLILSDEFMELLETKFKDTQNYLLRKQQIKEKKRKEEEKELEEELEKELELSPKKKKKSISEYKPEEQKFVSFESKKPEEEIITISTFEEEGEELREEDFEFEGEEEEAKGEEYVSPEVAEKIDVADTFVSEVEEDEEKTERKNLSETASISFEKKVKYGVKPIFIKERKNISDYTGEEIRDTLFRVKKKDVPENIQFLVKALLGYGDMTGSELILLIERKFYETPEINEDGKLTLEQKRQKLQEMFESLRSFLRKYTRFELSDFSLKEIMEVLAKREDKLSIFNKTVLSELRYFIESEKIGLKSDELPKTYDDIIEIYRRPNFVPQISVKNKINGLFREITKDEKSKDKIKILKQIENKFFYFVDLYTSHNYVDINGLGDKSNDYFTTEIETIGRDKYYIEVLKKIITSRKYKLLFKKENYGLDESGKLNLILLYSLLNYATEPEGWISIIKNNLLKLDSDEKTPKALYENLYIHQYVNETLVYQALKAKLDGVPSTDFYSKSDFYVYNIIYANLGKFLNNTNMPNIIEKNLVNLISMYLTPILTPMENIDPLMDVLTFLIISSDNCKELLNLLGNKTNISEEEKLTREYEQHKMELTTNYEKIIQQERKKWPSLKGKKLEEKISSKKKEEEIKLKVKLDKLEDEYKIKKQELQSTIHESQKIVDLKKQLYEAYANDTKKVDNIIDLVIKFLKNNCNIFDQKFNTIFEKWKNSFDTPKELKIEQSPEKIKETFLEQQLEKLMENSELIKTTEYKELLNLASPSKLEGESKLISESKLPRKIPKRRTSNKGKIKKQESESLQENTKDIFHDIEEAKKKEIILEYRNFIKETLRQFLIQNFRSKNSQLLSTIEYHFQNEFFKLNADKRYKNLILDKKKRDKEFKEFEKEVLPEIEKKYNEEYEKVLRNQKKKVEDKPNEKLEEENKKSALFSETSSSINISDSFFQDIVNYEKHLFNNPMEIIGKPYWSLFDYCSIFLKPRIFLSGVLKQYSKFFSDKVLADKMNVETFFNSSLAIYFPEALTNISYSKQLPENINKTFTEIYTYQVLRVNNIINKILFQDISNLIRGIFQITLQEKDIYTPKDISYIRDICSQFYEMCGKPKSYADYTVCKIGDEFACYNIEDLKKRFSESNYIIPGTQNKFPQYIVEKFTTQIPLEKKVSQIEISKSEIKPSKTISKKPTKEKEKSSKTKSSKTIKLKTKTK